MRFGSVRCTCSPLAVSRIRPRIPVAASRAAAPVSSARRDEQELLGAALGRESAQPAEQLAPDPHPAPGWGHLERALRGACREEEGELGRSDHTGPDPGPHAGRRRLIGDHRVRVGQRRDRRPHRRRDVAQRSGPHLLGRREAHPRTEQAGQLRLDLRGVVDEPSYRRQPLGGLVLELSLGADRDGDLRAAGRLDPLDELVGRAGVRNLYDEVVGDAAEVGVDLQGEDVHAGVAEAAGQGREGAGRVGQSGPDPEVHVARLTDPCSRSTSPVLNASTRLLLSQQEPGRRCYPDNKSRVDVSDRGRARGRRPGALPLRACRRSASRSSAAWPRSRWR